MNIKRSMLIKISLMIVVPFTLFSVLLLQTYNKKLSAVVEESLRSVTKAQTVLLTGFCQEQMNSLQQIGNTEVSKAALRGELSEEVLDYLNNLLFSTVQRVDYIENATIVSTDYRVVACSETDASAEAKHTIDILIDAMGENDFYISNVIDSNANNLEQDAVVAIMSIQDNGHTIGYILAQINLDFYENLREQSQFWEESTFYLLDGNNKIISAGTFDRQRSEFITTEEERRDYQEKYRAIDQDETPSGSFTYKVSGVNYVTYYSNVEYTDWILLLTINMDQYMVQRTTYGAVLVLLVMLCTVAAVWIGIFISRRIVRPINQISHTLNQIQEKEDYSLRINIEQNDEIGMLGKEINKLLHFVQSENLQRLQQQDLLQRRADQDALTKVLNKNRLNQYIQESIWVHQEQKTKAALMFLDIDDFKAFNTVYGHSVGDQVLLFISSLLQRETKGTVGRVGGDEFAVLVEDPVILESIEECLSQIEQMASEQFVLRNKRVQVPVSCCIGAVYVDFAKDYAKDVTVEHWLDLADAAMYKAKNNGKKGHIIWEYRN